MKIWYQSMTRLDRWGAYARVLPGILDKVKDPGTEIELHGITKVGGIGDQFRYLEFMETQEVLDNVRIAMERGFDAFLIGNTGEPGLREAREIANFPVLGLLESASLTACMMGSSFSFVTINEKYKPRIIEMVRRHGLSERLAGAHRMQLDRILDLDDGFEDPAAKKRILDQFMKAAKRNVDDGAEVVIAAGGVVVALLAHWEVNQTDDGTPVLNSIANLVKMGEAAVKLQRLTGGFHSKKGTYAPPSPDQILELRKYYGDQIYPTVHPPK
jgi:allantoin racemase